MAIVLRPPAFLPSKPNKYEAKMYGHELLAQGCQTLTSGLLQVIARFTGQLVFAVRV